MRHHILSLVFPVALSVGMTGCHISQQSPLKGDVAKDAELIKKGEYLAIAGDCVACHTSPDGGPSFAGGRKMPIPMLGSIYTSNITPDAKTGIGTWTLHDFDNAVRFGIAKDGSSLYPAMPYVSYSKISDDDIRALYAYFKYGVTPVQSTPTENEIPKVFSARWPLQIWNYLFVPHETYKVDAAKNPEWNRGAYLVQGLAHCGTCHTPRGVFMQEKALNEKDGTYLSGSTLAGWHAFNITADKTSGIGHWSIPDLVQYLSTGNLMNKAQAAGPMSEAVEHGLSKLSDQDVKAIATYIHTVPPVSDGSDKPRDSWGQPLNGLSVIRGKPLSDLKDPQQIFLAGCAKCHGPTGLGSDDKVYPSLVHNSAIGAKDPTNLIHVILNGIHREQTPHMDEVNMPAFNEKLNDEQIASLVNYLTEKFGNPATAKVSASDVKKLRDQN